MSTDDFRDRVRDLVVEMAATGQTGMGFPEEYGGGGDIGASVAAFETLAFGDLSVLVKVGVQFGLFGGAILQLGTKAHHDAYLADLVTGKLMGCFAMTETGHGSNVQALGTVATYDAETEEFVHHHAGRRVPQGLHRQRRPARRGRRWSSPSSRSAASRRACTRSSCRSARSGDGAARRPDRGLRPQARPQRRRQRPDLVRRTSGCRAARCSTGSPTSPPTARYESADREPQQAVLHHARHPRPGPGLRRRRRHQRRQGRAHHRDQVRRPPPPVQRHRRRTQEELLLDYGMHQRRLFPLIARTYALHFAQEVVAGAAARRLLRASTDDEHTRRELESRAAGTKVVGTWHATRTIQECREACGGAGYLVGEPVRRAQGRHRRVHHLRGRQPRPAAAGRQGPADRLRQRLRGPRPVRHGPVRGRPGRRDRASRRPTCTS